MLFLSMFVVIGVVMEISGMASLGNGSMKKLSVRTKVARFCLRNPVLCQFKMQMMELQNKADTAKRNIDDEELLLDSGINEQRELKNNADKMTLPGSNMACHFTDKSNTMIQKSADKIKMSASGNIATDIKILVKSLLVIPEAIIVCQPKTDKYVVKGKPKKDAYAKNDETNQSNEDKQTSVAEKRNISDMFKEIWQTRSDNAMMPRNLPWKKDEARKVEHIQRLLDVTRSLEAEMARDKILGMLRDILKKKK